MALCRFGKKVLPLSKRNKIEAAADALYWVRDSAQVTRILAPLSPEERKEAWKKAGKRAAVEKTKHRAVLELLRKRAPDSEEPNQ